MLLKQQMIDLLTLYGKPVRGIGPIGFSDKHLDTGDQSNSFDPIIVIKNVELNRAIFCIGLDTVYAYGITEQELSTILGQ